MHESNTPSLHSPKHPQWHCNKAIPMNSFIGLVIFVMLFLVDCPAGYGQHNSVATQRKTQSRGSVIREPEPFCPPKEIRAERFCPEKQSGVNAHRDCTALMQAAEVGN